MINPPPVRIGGREWAIRLIEPSSENLNGAAGRCHYGLALLTAAEDMSDIDIQDTVLHEVMHAIRYCQGRPYGGKVEEDYVQSLATGLIALFQDNPEFAQWITKPIPTTSPA